MNPSNCSHCGAPITDAETICINCGCQINRPLLITFEREKIFVGSNLPLFLKITGNDKEIEISLKNGESKTIPLMSGDYLITLIGKGRGLKKTTYQISFAKAATFKCYLIMGLFKSEFVLEHQ